MFHSLADNCDSGHSTSEGRGGTPGGGTEPDDANFVPADYDFGEPIIDLPTAPIYGNFQDCDSFVLKKEVAAVSMLGHLAPTSRGAKLALKGVLKKGWLQVCHGSVRVLVPAHLKEAIISVYRNYHPIVPAEDPDCLCDRAGSILEGMDWSNILEAAGAHSVVITQWGQQMPVEVAVDYIKTYGRTLPWEHNSVDISWKFKRHDIRLVRFRDSPLPHEDQDPGAGLSEGDEAPGVEPGQWQPPWREELFTGQGKPPMTCSQFADCHFTGRGYGGVSMLAPVSRPCDGDIRRIVLYPLLIHSLKIFATGLQRCYPNTYIKRSRLRPTLLQLLTRLEKEKNYIGGWRMEVRCSKLNLSLP